MTDTDSGNSSDAFNTSDSVTDTSDSFTETTTTSWFSRIVASIKGVLFGLVLIVAMCVLLFWNEGRAVQTARSLAEGIGLVVDVAPNTIDPAMESKLVHVSGEAKAQTPLIDPEFGVTASALKLDRKVEMYQWKQEEHSETHKNTGGSETTTTTYSYTRVWSDDMIDSQKFKQASGHNNPPMRYRATTLTARDATLGAFRPGQSVLAKLSADDIVRAEPAVLSQIKAKVRGSAEINDGQIYLGDSANNPKIGDLRIDYRAAPNGPISVIGRQTATDLTPYQTKAGDRLLIVRSGIVSADEMFKSEEQLNRILTWALRLVGVLFMFVGFTMLLAPLVVVADFVPLIGSVLGAGTSLVSLALTAALAPLVIAIAWFFYRPLVAVLVLAAGFAIAYGFRTLAARRTAARAVAKPTPAAMPAGTVPI